MHYLVFREIYFQVLTIPRPSSGRVRTPAHVVFPWKSTSSLDHFLSLGRQGQKARSCGEEQPQEALDEHGNLGASQLGLAVQPVDKDDGDLPHPMACQPGTYYDLHLERVPLHPNKYIIYIVYYVNIQYIIR